MSCCSLPDRENRIASLESKIRSLELEIQRVDISNALPTSRGIKRRLMAQLQALFPKKPVYARPVFDAVPILATPQSSSARTVAGVEPTYLAHGYGTLVSRIEIDDAVNTWKPDGYPSHSLIVLL